MDKALCMEKIWSDLYFECLILFAYGGLIGLNQDNGDNIDNSVLDSRFPYAS